MRIPTTAAQALAWHNRALSDRALHLELDIDYDDPQPGWYLTRMVRGGPLLPARLFIEQEVCPDTGELLSDECLKCEINGQLRDPFEAWIWLANEPIEESAFNYLMARKSFAETFAPSEPSANPFQKVDWLSVPTPSFTEGTPT